MSDDKKVVPLFSNKKEEEINFKVFNIHIMNKEYDKATRVLRTLIDIDYELAEQMTNHYSSKMKEGPQVAIKLMSLKPLLENKQTNEALMIIQDVFNVYGLNAIKLLDKITKILA